MIFSSFTNVNLTCQPETGRQCRLIKNIGERLSKTIGGEAFSIDISKNIIDIPQGIASSLLPGKATVRVMIYTMYPHGRI